MIVNFRKVKFYTGIDRKESIEQDISLDFANMIYYNSDIRGLRLAEKIYQAEDEIELTDEEIALIRSLINQHCTAMMVDAINHLFKINNDERV